MACVQPVAMSYADIVKRTSPSLPFIDIPAQTCRSQSRTPSPTKDMQPSFFATCNKKVNSEQTGGSNDETGAADTRQSGLVHMWQLEDFCKQLDQVDNTKEKQLTSRCPRCNAEQEDLCEICSDCQEELRSRLEESQTQGDEEDNDDEGNGNCECEIDGEDEEEEEDSEDSEDSDSCTTCAEDAESGTSDDEEEGYYDATDQVDSHNDVDGADSGKAAASNDHVQEEDGSEYYENGEQEDKDSVGSGPSLPPRLLHQNAVGTYPSKEYCQKLAMAQENGAKASVSKSVYPDISHYYSNNIESLDSFDDSDFFISAGRPSFTSLTYAFPKKASRDIEDVVNFWETDFQVGDAMIPSIGSWERRGMAPERDLENIDYRRYMCYKKLYLRWLDCSKSLERWYEKYWGNSLVKILQTKASSEKALICNCCRI